VSPGGSVPYKFVVNGGTWETGDNRGFILPSSGQTLPVDYFDRLDNLGPLSASVGPFGEVTVSWTAGPGVRLQVAGDLNPPKWEDVPDTLGQSSATVFDGFFDGPPVKFFRLTGP
jgi:hypothetical protein